MNWPAGTVLYIVYAEPGRWSTGPMVIAEGQHEAGWLEGVLTQAREKGCDIVKTVVAEETA